ncbi:MAG: tetratricopeptide repeat-containing glycosyltransferase family protein [Alphaproteobacteria bacterium]
MPTTQTMPARSETALSHALELFNAGRLAEAAHICKAILAEDLSNASARFLLGMVELGNGEAGAAIRHLSVAARSRPDNALFHFYHGNALQAGGFEPQALGAYRRALAIEPTHAASHYNLGVCLARLGAYEEACVAYRAALNLSPNDPTIYYNLANALVGQREYTTAVANYREALDRQPAWPSALINLGNTLHRLGRNDEAESAYYRALSLDPENAGTFYNLGVLLMETDRLPQAATTLGRALELDPNYGDAGWNLALTNLGLGDLRNGLPMYENRWMRSAPGLDCIHEQLQIPQWDGSSLTGQSLLIACEQGIGDELMFAACIPDVIAKAAHVVIECAPKLVPLFRRAFPTATVEAAITWRDDEGFRRHSYSWLDELPDHQQPSVFCPSGSLPLMLHKAPAALGRDEPLVRSDGRSVAGWRRRLARLGDGPKIGLCWRSSVRNEQRKWLYASLMSYTPLLSLPGATFIDLQYDDSSTERIALEAAHGLRLHRFDDLDMTNDLDRTANLIAALDLVVSAPTAVAQLAGAVGTPAWRVSVGADWSTLGCERYPWFPCVRAFKLNREENHAEQIAGLARIVKADLGL